MIDKRTNINSNSTPVKKQVISCNAPLRGVPDIYAIKAKQESELIYGDIFNVYEEKDGLSFGQNEFDNYVGYIQSKYLSNIKESTHILTAIRSHLYKKPDMRSLIKGALSLGSSIQIIKTEEKYSKLDSGTWVFNSHIEKKPYIEKDYIKTAKKFIGTPYVWGANSCNGIDCSALVQISLKLAGINIPRDTDQQLLFLEKHLINIEQNELQKGDILFFDEHVAMMIDNKNIIHAKSYHMAVVIEPLEKEMLRANKNGIAGICRFT